MKKQEIFDEESEGWNEFIKEAATEAFTKAARETMEVMGYNLIAKDGWLVKSFPDGSYEKVKKLKKIKRPTQLFD